MAKKILAVVGSLREGSFNRMLAMKAKELVGDEAEFEILDYSGVPLLNQDIEFPAPEAVATAREKIKEADGIWIFCPEYNHFFSGVLKNFLDWMSRPVSNTEGQVMNGKKIAISGISPGMSGTALAQDHLVTLLAFLNADIMNMPRLTIPHAMGLIKDGKLELGESEKYLLRQKDAFLKFIEE
ncbi:chromate reductase [Lachnospiraceae bacterium PF1-21]|uniref:NAD(P)H-dependent oxidoreductase n=1 Tax=Ohessyouella blattaphilus TaxID=2949333 RepID=A0ABT1EIX6_9FIRM|nr:NADPH-dependent FMN reductase [Ohessyouella blattaphilus]MCP1110655.1 NAD(P)H-dependent oxidoreductase [Ohessyouella blattaphilus]MCR8564049.1 NAD(P)H-dependent oxidoreductase [Ohessyouella blattaphilus]MDL2250397.1 NAD(P)H-dependent oxidoreductase [Lachnospiraceae bacterium OttesenSCG-928-J05]